MARCAYCGTVIPRRPSVGPVVCTAQPCTRRLTLDRLRLRAEIAEVKRFGVVNVARGAYLRRDIAERTA